MRSKRLPRFTFQTVIIRLHAARILSAICKLKHSKWQILVRSSLVIRVACALLTCAPKGVHMDALYLGVTLVFFALSWGLIVLCEKL